MANTILSWIAGILAFSYLVMNCIYGFYFTYSYDLENNIIIKMIEETLNGKLIYSFRNSTECKSNEEELIIDRFEGTPEFCSCYGTYMGIGKCAKEQDYCQTINSIPPNDLTMINSQHICVRKSDKSYLDFLNNNEIISKDKECPSNYKSYGIIDTLKRKLCVKNNNNCPIKKDNIGNNTDNSSQILTLFKIRPNYPCIDPNEKNWNYHGDLLPLTKICTESDKRYERIDKFNTNLYDLYKDNNILTTLPSYDENVLKNESIYLYARNFLGINEEKASQFSKEELLSSQKLINNCNVAMKIVTLILILPLCCLGGGGASSSGGSCVDAIFALLGIYTIPAAIIYFILSIIIFVNNNIIVSMLDIGSDEFMNSAIKTLLEGNSVNFGFPLATMIAFPIIVILGILAICVSESDY
jgi:hypothetical protein